MTDMESLATLDNGIARTVILEVPVVEGLLHQILLDHDLLDIDEPKEDLISELVNGLLNRPADLMLDEPICEMLDASIDALSLNGVDVDIFSILSFEIVDEFSSIEMRIF